MANKKNIVKWLLFSLWCCIGIGTVVLLVAAIKKEDKQLCAGYNVTIKGASNNFFVDKNDILNILNEYMDGGPKGHQISTFNLKSLEGEMQKNIWVKAIVMYFDNNAMLQINVLEREPVARVFTTAGTSFYIDSALKILPLSDKISARLPVFTNFPSDKIILSKKDSALLKEVYQLSMAIQKNPFRMAMIEQVDITPSRKFEMMPKIGNTIIAFGNAEEADDKFERLQLFYKNIITKCGWNYYSVVNLQYKDQVVAKRKGAEDFSADSLRTLDLIKQIAVNAELRATDSLLAMQQDNEKNSTDVSLIQQSIQRDDNEEAQIAMPQLLPNLPAASAIAAVKPTNIKSSKPLSANVATPAKPVPNPMKKVNAVKPVTKPAVVKPIVAKPVIKKPIIKLPTKPPEKQKPKVLMPAKAANDYR
jgi:cell division protein FtsQ